MPPRIWAGDACTHLLAECLPEDTLLRGWVHGPPGMGGGARTHLLAERLPEDTLLRGWVHGPPDMGEGCMHPPLSRVSAGRHSAKGVGAWPPRYEWGVHVPTS